jgi:excisionase family DNA binding protein
VVEYGPSPNRLPYPGMEDRSEGKRRLTVREAATLLGVHPNTVRNRIKDGSLEAEKVLTERGPTWMIDPDSLTTNTPPSASQQLVGRVPEEALTFLAREIVREARKAWQPRARTTVSEARKRSATELSAPHVPQVLQLPAPRKIGGTPDIRVRADRDWRQRRSMDYLPIWVVRPIYPRLL